MNHINTPKHTSGEWSERSVAEQNNSHHRQILVDGKPIAQVLHRVDVPEEEALTNVALMGLAPKMLALLDEAYGELLADSHRDGPRCLLLSQMEAVFAKAGEV